MNIRPAVPADAEGIAALVNRAFTVERFFKVGDRTSSNEIASMLLEGDFLVGEFDGSPAGSVFVRATPPVGYFGMLSIDPTVQGAAWAVSSSPQPRRTCGRAAAGRCGFIS